jgi:DNA-binding CsgD family transcriptional regulator
MGEGEDSGVRAQHTPAALSPTQPTTRFSSSEIDAFVELALRCDGVRDPDSFCDWCRKEVRAFLPYGMLIVAAGHLTHGLLFVDTLLGVDYPQEFMQKILRRVPLNERKVIQTWLACRQPQIVTPADIDEKLSELERFEFESFDLRNFAAHGVIDAAGTQASYFSFARLAEPLDDRARNKLKLLAPHLHQALMAALAPAVEGQPAPSALSLFTTRQLLVLRGLLEGLTNAQIASWLNRSPHTVKHQVERILKNLGATNRAEAISKALDLGIAVLPLRSEDCMRKMGKSGY